MALKFTMTGISELMIFCCYVCVVTFSTVISFLAIPRGIVEYNCAICNAMPLKELLIPMPTYYYFIIGFQLGIDV
jgi:hypothetical protein